MFTQADSYQRFMGRWSELLAPELIRYAGIRDADYVLDVGSGTGVLSRALANEFARVRVEGIDASDAFVRYATEHLGSSRERVRFQVCDARELGFPNATFDAALSSLVLNFVPDHARAVREMMRVTKPGGVFAATVWNYGDSGMEMLRVFWDEAGALDADAKARDERAMTLCRAGALAKLCSDQGLENVHASSITIPLRFTSFDDFWSPYLLGVGPAGAYVVGLTIERQNELRKRLEKRLLAGGSDKPITMNGRAWAVKGTVPR